MLRVTNNSINALVIQSFLGSIASEATTARTTDDYSEITFETVKLREPRWFPVGGDAGYWCLKPGIARRGSRGC